METWFVSVTKVLRSCFNLRARANQRNGSVSVTKVLRSCFNFDGDKNAEFLLLVSVTKVLRSYFNSGTSWFEWGETSFSDQSLTKLLQLSYVLDLVRQKSFSDQSLTKLLQQAFKGQKDSVYLFQWPKSYEAASTNWPGHVEIPHSFQWPKSYEATSTSEATSTKKQRYWSSNMGFSDQSLTKLLQLNLCPTN